MRVIFILIVSIVVFPAFAQTEFSLYRLNATVPQANMLNPAFAPSHRLVIGLPVISGIYAAADTDGLSFSDLFKSAENDSLQLDTLTLFSRLHESNRLQLKEAVQIFYLGLRGKKSYFSLGVHQVMETRFHYPGDLIGWGIRGPGDAHYRGKALDFSNFYGRSMAYAKVSVNYGRDVTPALRVGVRFNYLLGIAAGETTRIEGNLAIGIDSVSINSGDIQVQTAGVDFFDQDNLEVADYQNYLLKGKNKGMSWDLGATYNITDNLMVSAAVNDLGYINWKDYTRSYQIAPVNYTFRGFDVLDYINKDPGDEFLEAELDSLESLYKATETTGGKFKTSLIGKFYAGVNFRVLRVNNFSALVYFDLFNKKIDPAVSVGYNLQLGRLLNTTVGITYQNGRINNIGAGIALKLTNMQVYATSDRGNSFVYPSRASRADAHLGMNLVFGKVKKNNDTVKKKDEEEESTPVEEAPKDTTVSEPVVTPPAQPDTTARTVSQPVQQETVAAPVGQPEPVVAQPQPEVQQPVTTPVVEPAAEPRHETVTRGTHAEELEVAHYVIVGSFKQRTNAQRYSNLIKDRGYDSRFGFVSAKGVYYVFVQATANLEEARATRDQFRAKPDFQFPSSWVLTVE